MVIVKRVNKHAACSDQQHENLKKQENLLLVKVEGCKFLLDCFPEPKLFSFEHTALAVSTRVCTILNTMHFPSLCL